MLETSYSAGIKAFEEKKYEEASVLFIQAMTDNPEITTSYLYLGECYFFCQERQQAIAALTKFVELQQNDPGAVENLATALDLLGQCYEAEKKPMAALRSYQQASQIAPHCASAWHNMGLLYLHDAQHTLESDLEKSVDLFNKAYGFIQRALTIAEDSPLLLHSIASWYEQYVELLERLIGEDERDKQQKITQTFRQAIHYYQQALLACTEQFTDLKNIILENLTECLAQFGHHLYRAHDYEEAKKIYLEVIERDPAHLTVINQLGMCFSKQHCFAKARSFFLSILEETTDTQELADAWLNIAYTYRVEKNWDEAAKALRLAKEFAPQDSAIIEEELQWVAAKLAAGVVSTALRLFEPQNRVSDKKPAVHESLIASL